MIAFFLLLLSAFAGTYTVDILDIGQGDAIVIRSPEGKTVLIDGGTGKVDVVAELRKRNISEINLMIATHAHADHIGGLDEVLSSMPVKLFVDSGMPHTTRTYEKVMSLVETKKIKYLEAKNGQQFNLGSEASLEILHPQDALLRNTRSDLNSNSVIVRMIHKKNCFLFTGDAEEPTEHTLVQKGLTPCNVLKVAHHGSNHSSSTEFLNAVQPDIALISLGVDNRYGHPGEDTMARLQRTGADIYRTDLQGSITVESDGRKLKVFTEKGDNKGRSIVSKEKDVYHSSETNMEVSSADHGSKFNINTATEAQLDSIPGIGPAKAQAILADRAANGPFRSISDLTRVSGIGEKTAANIAEYAYVEGAMK